VSPKYSQFLALCSVFRDTPGRRRYQNQSSFNTEPMQNEWFVPFGANALTM